MQLINKMCPEDYINVYIQGLNKKLTRRCIFILSILFIYDLYTHLDVYIYVLYSYILCIIMYNHMCEEKKNGL